MARATRLAAVSLDPHRRGPQALRRAPGRIAADGGHRRRARAAATWVTAAAMLVSACGGPATPPSGPLNAPTAGLGRGAVTAAPPASAAGFDQAASAGLLARGRQAESGGNAEEAMRLYREAGMRWPDSLDAWTALATLAGRTHNRQEEEAATFMVDRLRLYPSDALYVQREVNTALRLYVAERRARPDANPAQLAYAERLADFYGERYALRGVYEPLSQFANLENREIPAAVVLVAGGAIYLALLLSRGSGSS